MSASAVVAGIFPPVNDQIWNENLLWRPIPIHTVPKEMDYILSRKKSCPRYNQAWKMYKKSAEYKNLAKRFRSTYQYLEKHSGKEIKNFQSAQILYDTLRIEYLRNKT